MLLCAVSVLVVAQSSSEIPEGLMNSPVLVSTVHECDNNDSNINSKNKNSNSDIPSPTFRKPCIESLFP